MMKNLLILQSLIGTRYMIAIFAMEHQFNFLFFHLLVHTKLNIFYGGCQPNLKLSGDSLPVCGNENLILYHFCRSISIEG
jgi:hypothetical protein